jgi:hypothetical protein
MEAQTATAIAVGVGIAVAGVVGAAVYRWIFRDRREVAETSTHIRKECLSCGWQGLVSKFHKKCPNCGDEI